MSTFSHDSASSRFFSRKIIRRLLGAAFALTIFFATIWLERTTLLREAANLWIISDPVENSDVVAILGGGLEVRPFVAADLYKKGLVKRILVSHVAEARTVEMGAAPGHSELNRRLLLKLGVPDTDIDMFGSGNRSTRDEAAALRDWAGQHHISRIIIPTEIFSARRVQWIFDHEFAGSAVDIRVPSFDGPGYTRTEWWRTEAGMIAFQNEIMKYLYYRLKF